MAERWVCTRITHRPTLGAGRAHTLSICALLVQNRFQLSCITRQLHRYMHSYRTMLPKCVWQCSITGVVLLQHDTSPALCPLCARSCCPRHVKMVGICGASNCVRAGAARRSFCSSNPCRCQQQHAAVTLASSSPHPTASQHSISHRARQNLP